MCSEITRKPSGALGDDLCGSGVIDSPSLSGAVYREAVFGDLRRPPQIYHGHVRSIFVTFRTLA